jgi:hypothetical protein
MSVKGLDQAIKNLASLSKTAVPKASAQAVNKIASLAINSSTTRVSKEVKAPRKLIRERVRLKRATARKPQAVMRVFRKDLPVIRLGPVQTRLTKGRAVLRAGRHSFPDGFVRQLKNGRWHILRRLGKERLPIEVVKIPLLTPLTRAYSEETTRLVASEMSGEMAKALKKQFEWELRK